MLKQKPLQLLNLWPPSPIKAASVNNLEFGFSLRKWLFPFIWYKSSLCTLLCYSGVDNKPIKPDFRIPGQSVTRTWSFSLVWEKAEKSRPTHFTSRGSRETAPVLSPKLPKKLFSEIIPVTSVFGPYLNVIALRKWGKFTIHSQIWPFLGSWFSSSSNTFHLTHSSDTHKLKTRNNITHEVGDKPLLDS